MKRCLLVAAAAHLLLLALLYLDHLARSAAQAATREQQDRRRHEQLHEHVLQERRRERQAGALGAGPGGERGGLPGAGGAAGQAVPYGRTSSRRLQPGFGARGAAVARVVDENAVLAELLGARPVPARELAGEPAGITWAFLDSWYTLGPFALEAPPLPVHGSIDLDARHVSKSGTSITWRFLQRSGPEIAPETMTSYSVHYAFTRLRSDRQRDVWMAFGADDSLQVWLDGVLIWDCGEHWRAWDLVEGARRVTLRAGESQLFARLRNWPTVGAFSVVLRVAP